MAALDLSSLGVSAVDVATIEYDVINQVKECKKKALQKELEGIESEIDENRKQIETVKCSLCW